MKSEEEIQQLRAAKRLELEEAARRAGTSLDQIIREAIMIKRWLEEDDGGHGTPRRVKATRQPFWKRLFPRHQPNFA